jgi:hypothetical protein
VAEEDLLVAAGEGLGGSVGVGAGVDVEPRARTVLTQYRDIGPVEQDVFPDAVEMQPAPVLQYHRLPQRHRNAAAGSASSKPPAIHVCDPRRVSGLDANVTFPPVNRLTLIRHANSLPRM